MHLAAGHGCHRVFLSHVCKHGLPSGRGSATAGTPAVALSTGRFITPPGSPLLSSPSPTLHTGQRAQRHMRSGLSVRAAYYHSSSLRHTGVWSSATDHLASSKRRLQLSPPANNQSSALSSLSSVQKRQLATVSDDMSVHRSKYAAVVVGAGPAGICAVGNMLERKVGPILWVDDVFDGGRVNARYREVPSNTKTKLFIDFAEKLAPFRQIIEKTPSPNAIDKLRDMPQDKGCQLGNAADMLLMLTRGLMKTPGVEVRKGRVHSASVDSHRGWTVSLNLSGHDSPILEPSTVISDRVILCTGSSPTEGPIPISDVPNLQNLHLDTALSPSYLAQTLDPTKEVTIGVIGASHSAVLVLLNLSRLAQSSHPKLRVRWFTRHALRYAEFMDGWILRDNTGLKGEAADWARENLEPEVFPKSPVARFIQPVSYPKDRELQTYKEYLPGCDYLVQAVGYTRDTIVQLKRGVGTLEVSYDHTTGAFADAETGEKIPGLYGAGIAWPERVTDPHGNVEYAVGFFKFMKYLNRVSCDWN